MSEKYYVGQECWAKDTDHKVIIQSICGNVITFSMHGNRGELHFICKELFDECYTTKDPDKIGWVNITEDDWLEHRDSAVWYRNNNGNPKIGTLVFFNTLNAAYPFVILKINGVIEVFKYCSLTNDAGEVATWEN